MIIIGNAVPRAIGTMPIFPTFRGTWIHDFREPYFRFPGRHGTVFRVMKKSDGLMNLTQGRQEAVAKPGVLFPPCLYPPARLIDAEPFRVIHTDPSLHVR